MRRGESSRGYPCYGGVVVTGSDIDVPYPVVDMDILIDIPTVAHAA